MSPNSLWRCRVSLPVIVRWPPVNGLGIGHYYYFLSRFKMEWEEPKNARSKKKQFNYINCERKSKQYLCKL